MAAIVDGPRAVVLRNDDKVAVAARPIPRGFRPHARRRGRSRSASRSGWATRSRLPTSTPGEPVRKYGQIIGFASQGDRGRVAGPRAQPQGRPVRARLRLCLRAARRAAGRTGRATFRGYLRPDGRVGTRNYIAVISTVNCSASTSRYVADRFRDGALAPGFSQHRRRLRHHPQGGLRAAVRRARPPDPRARAGRFRPSSQRGGVRDRRPRLRGRLRLSIWSRRSILVTLGEPPVATGTSKPAHRPRMLNIQEEGGITRTVEAAVRAVYELMPEANSWRRTEQPASKICLAMECGGSDGNSGVTANPALGRGGRPA